jgi:hypothetical protein
VMDAADNLRGHRVGVAAADGGEDLSASPAYTQAHPRGQHRHERLIGAECRRPDPVAREPAGRLQTRIPDPRYCKS